MILNPRDTGLCTIHVSVLAWPMNMGEFVHKELILLQSFIKCTFEAGCANYHAALLVTEL